MDVGKEDERGVGRRSRDHEVQITTLNPLSVRE